MSRWGILNISTLLMKEVPSGNLTGLLLKMTIEIVDFPIKHGDFP